MRRAKEEKARRFLTGQRRSSNPYARYQADPCGYARDVLGQLWWEKQREVAEALLTHKKVAVPAGQGVGKSHLCAGIVNWWFDCFRPGKCLTSAPTSAQVEDILWSEIRTQRPGMGDLQPKAPRMETGPEHFAVGYTARDANSFQGRHDKHLLIVFDEADGIDGQFFEAAEGMTTGPENRFLCIYNPVESSSRMAEEEASGEWHVLTVSCLDHPNIAAQLAGLPMPYPKAVSLEWLEDKVRKWCTPVTGAPKATDIEWPPGAGVWYRPGPLFESRVLGRRASQGIDSVWSDALWEAANREQPEPDEPVTLGCDVARFGDDFTCIYARRGPCVLHAESHNGWGTDETAGRLKQLCGEYGRYTGQDPKKVRVNVDDDGIGGAVYDQRGDYTFVQVSGAAKANDPEEYPNQRSELWFANADRAGEGRIDLSRLPAEAKAELKRQLKAPKWKLDGQGRRVVEPKEVTKKRLKRSPDDADAFNLCYATPRVKREARVY